MSSKIYPNPFKKKIDIRFSIGHETNCIELRIYDVTGRVVRDFQINQLTNSPVNQIIWDGTDDSGKKLPTGVYFYFLKLDKEEYRGKIIRLE